MRLAMMVESEKKLIVHSKHNNKLITNTYSFNTLNTHYTAEILLRQNIVFYTPKSPASVCVNHVFDSARFFFNTLNIIIAVKRRKREKKQQLSLSRVTSSKKCLWNYNKMHLIIIIEGEKREWR